jgi:hypothetical protein
MHRLQLPHGLLLGQRQGAADDGGDALGAGGNEGADDDPRALRQEPQVVATNTDGAQTGAIGG